MARLVFTAIADADGAGIIEDLANTAGRVTALKFSDLFNEVYDRLEMVRSITPIHALARRFWYTHYRPYDLATAAKLHAVIMEAIVAGDAVAAAAASDALLDYVEAFTRAVS